MCSRDWSSDVCSSDLDWQRVLTDLEGEVLLAEETLARGRADEIATWGRRTEDWVAPSTLGPLPLDLRERSEERRVGKERRWRRSPHQASAAKTSSRRL